MATLGGDLIRLLAHTALQTGGNIGTELVKNWLTPDTILKAELLKQYIPTMSTGSEEERNAVGRFIEERTGFKLPRAPMTNVAGTEVTSPEGAKLTAPSSTPLTELAGGYTPRMGFVRPPTEKLEALASGLLSRKIVGGPEDVSVGTGILSALKPPRTSHPGELQYIMELPQDQREQALTVLMGKKDPALMMFLNSPEGRKAIEGYKSAGKGLSHTDLLLAAAKNPDLARSLGVAATSMQAQPPQVDVLNPEAPTQPTKTTRGAVVLPKTTALEPSLVAQEQKLTSNITETLGKMQYTLPANVRDQMKQVLNQNIGSLNEVRTKQGKTPINTSDFIENNYNIALQTLKSQKDKLGVEGYNAKLQALNERKKALLLGIGAQ